MSIFEHADPRRVWHEFYRWACYCHPDQGGDPRDFDALCAQARAALPDWPLPDAPTLFDIFCRATGCTVGDPVGDPAAADAPAPWVADVAACAPVSPVGRLRLWPRSSGAAGPPSRLERPPR